MKNTRYGNQYDTTASMVFPPSPVCVIRSKSTKAHAYTNWNQGRFYHSCRRTRYYPLTWPMQRLYAVKRPEYLHCLGLSSKQIHRRFASFLNVAAGHSSKHVKFKICYKSFQDKRLSPSLFLLHLENPRSGLAMICALFARSDHFVSCCFFSGPLPMELPFIDFLDAPKLLRLTWRSPTSNTEISPSPPATWLPAPCYMLGLRMCISRTEKL